MVPRNSALQSVMPHSKGFPTAFRAEGTLRQIIRNRKNCVYPPVLQCPQKNADKGDCVSSTEQLEAPLLYLVCFPAGHFVTFATTPAVVSIPMSPALGNTL